MVYYSLNGTTKLTDGLSEDHDIGCYFGVTILKRPLRYTLGLDILFNFHLLYTCFVQKYESLNEPSQKMTITPSGLTALTESDDKSIEVPLFSLLSNYDDVDDVHYSKSEFEIDEEEDGDGYMSYHEEENFTANTATLCDSTAVETSSMSNIRVSNNYKIALAYYPV